MTDRLPPDVERIRVWDLPLRIFHWSLAFCVIAGWLLGQFGPSKMTLHFWLGYATIALLAFRVVWGFVGPQDARFLSFVQGPRSIGAYMRHMHRREPSYWHGHNPLGALSAVAMIVVLGAQAFTGLISDPEDYVNVGPLAGNVSGSLSHDAVGWHETGALLILLLVVLHVGVILFYRFWKRENLVGPMLTGWKMVRRR